MGPKQLPMSRIGSSRLCHRSIVCQWALIGCFGEAADTQK